MIYNKLKELIDKTAATALVNPEICVVTFSHTDGLELRWSDIKGLGQVASVYAQFMLDRLYTRNNIWFATDFAHVRKISLDVRLEHEVALTYKDFLAFYREKEQPISGIVDLIIDKAKLLYWEDNKVESVIDPKYAIKTQYYIDIQNFDTMKEAKEHQKTLQIFDQFQIAGIQEYDIIKEAINDMVKNPDKYIKILQGK